MSIKGGLKWKAAVYDITINTNKSLVGTEPEKIESLKTALEIYIRTVFNKNDVHKILVDKTGKAKKTGLRNITVKSVIEANTHGLTFLHSHTILRVEYQDSVKVNADLVKKTVYKYFEKALTINGKFLKPYVHIKFMPDTAYNAENYITSENRNAEFIKEIN